MKQVQYNVEGESVENRVLREKVWRMRYELEATPDGPVTPFIMMVRASELVLKGCDPEVVINALHTSLQCCFKFNMNKELLHVQ